MSSTLFGLHAALRVFVGSSETQSRKHIEPLHWHIAARLVIEGGFAPDNVTPRPPLRVETAGTGANRAHRLVYDEKAAQSGEQTLLGGLKTKQVDVVVSKKDIGPCLAVSVKGSLGAFRNLTNRMEEAAGDCTNLHIAYPALVYGFLHVMRANRETGGQKRNDIAVYDSGVTAGDIAWYHDTMVRLTGRRDVRNDASRYEAVSVILADTTADNIGEVFAGYPPPDSPLLMSRFFSRLYEVYDLRFVYAAPALESKTRRLEWASDSPALATVRAEGFLPRTA